MRMGTMCAACRIGRDGLELWAGIAYTCPCFHEKCTKSAEKCIKYVWLMSFVHFSYIFRTLFVHFSNKKSVRKVYEKCTKNVRRVYEKCFSYTFRTLFVRMYYWFGHAQSCATCMHSVLWGQILGQYWSNLGPSQCPLGPLINSDIF